MIDVRVEGLKQLERDLRVSGTKSDAFAGAMRKAGFRVRGALRRSLAAGGPLHRRSGALQRSVTYRLEKDAVAGWVAVVRPRIGYAETHMRGKTITAKTERGLLFPAAFANGQAVPGGVVRRTRRQAEKAAAKAGAAQSGRYTKTRGEKRRGAAYYTGKDLRPFRIATSREFARHNAGVARIGWIRKQSVTIPARDFLTPAATAAASDVAELLGAGFLPRVLA